MESFEAAADKEAQLKRMFIDLYAEEKYMESVVEPFYKTIGEVHLKLFYKFLWWKLKSPLIDDFGKKFFLELCDAPFQIYLV